MKRQFGNELMKSEIRRYRERSFGRAKNSGRVVNDNDDTIIASRVKDKIRLPQSRIQTASLSFASLDTPPAATSIFSHSFSNLPVVLQPHCYRPL